MFAQLLCLLFLSCPAQYDDITSWGTKYRVDPVRYEAAKLAVRDCMVATFDKDYPTPEALREDVETCYWLNEEQLKIGDVYTFYAAENDPKFRFFEEFDMCASGLSSHMWDFAEGSTVESFRESVGQCVELYPGLPHIHYSSAL